MLVVAQVSSRNFGVEHGLERGPGGARFGDVGAVLLGGT